MPGGIVVVACLWSRPRVLGDCDWGERAGPRAGPFYGSQRSARCHAFVYIQIHCSCIHKYMAVLPNLCNLLVSWSTRLDNLLWSEFGESSTRLELLAHQAPHPSRTRTWAHARANPTPTRECAVVLCRCVTWLSDDRIMGCGGSSPLEPATPEQFDEALRAYNPGSDQVTQQLFRLIDLNGNGFISRDEYQKACPSLGVTTSNSFFSGQMNYEEFVDMLKQGTVFGRPLATAMPMVSTIAMPVALATPVVQ